MKKILLVAYHYPPEGSSSGVLRTLKFSKYLPQLGWTPHILTLNDQFYTLRDPGLTQEIPQEVRVYRTWALDTMKSLSLWGYHLDLLTIPDRLIGWVPFAVKKGLEIINKEGIDAIFSTSPYSTTHLIAAALKKKTGVRWIADFRDPWIEEGLYPPPGTLRCWIEKHLEKKIVQFADRITVTTSRFRDDFAQRYPDIPCQKFQVIFNGYDDKDFDSTPPQNPNGYFEILHAGQVNADFRDPFPFLEALHLLIRDGEIAVSEVKVTFLGGGDYVTSAGFVHKINELGLKKVVSVVNRVSYAESLKRQKAATVLLLLQDSSDTNTLIPAKAFEYLRLARPVLALTREGATTDLLEEFEGCFWKESIDSKGIKTMLQGLYGQWKTEKIHRPIVRSIEKYERRNLTKELSYILNALV